MPLRFSAQIKRHVKIMRLPGLSTLFQTFGSRVTEKEKVVEILDGFRLTRAAIMYVET